MKLRACNAKQRLGLMRKGHPCQNYHVVLEEWFHLSKIFKERMNLLGNGFKLVTMWHITEYFPLVAFIIGDSQSQGNICGKHLHCTRCVEHVISLQKELS